MDKVIEEEVTVIRRKKVLLITVLIISIFVASAWLLRSSFKSAVKRSSITTAIVEKGNIENTITASGVVLPEFEEIITSPINASIQKVLLDAGREVKGGESVLMLDKAATQMTYETLQFQLESKRNN